MGNSIDKTKIKINVVVKNAYETYYLKCVHDKFVFKSVAPELAPDDLIRTPVHF